MDGALLSNKVRQSFKRNCLKKYEICLWDDNNLSCSLKEKEKRGTILIQSNLKGVKLEAIKFTDKISTEVNETTGRISLKDSNNNLQCLSKELEIRTLGKNNWNYNNVTLDDNFSFLKSRLNLPTGCSEHMITIKVRNLSNSDSIYNETFKSLIRLENLALK